MPRDDKAAALLALDQAVDLTADELTATIKALRQRRKAAMKAGDPKAAATIGKKLSLYGQTMADLDRGTVRKLDDDKAIADLTKGFKAAAAELREARRDIEETKALLDKVTKVVGVIAKLAAKVLV